MPPYPARSSALRIAGEISSALEYLHSQTPRHHDLKPDNVMLTVALQANLIDFDLASTVATINATHVAQVGGPFGGIPATYHPRRCCGSSSPSSCRMSR